MVFGEGPIRGTMTTMLRWAKDQIQKKDAGGHGVHRSPLHGVVDGVKPRRGSGPR